MRAIISVKPDAPILEEWALHISPNPEYRVFEDPDLITLQGFESMFDAWAFAVCHLDIDVCKQNKVSSEWTYQKPYPRKPKQIKMSL